MMKSSHKYACIASQGRGAYVVVSGEQRQGCTSSCLSQPWRLRFACPGGVCEVCAGLTAGQWLESTC